MKGTIKVQNAKGVIKEIDKRVLKWYLEARWKVVIENDKIKSNSKKTTTKHS